jgi:hypothetical protein
MLHYKRSRWPLLQPNEVFEVRFEVLTAASMMIVVFWVVAPRILVEFHRRFRGVSIIRTMMEAASTSEMSLNFYQNTRRNNTEDSRLRSVLNYRT